MLVLVRHGQATANAAGLLLGRSDVPLTDTGVAQVAALAAHVGPVDRVISSPLRRALDTAAAFGAAVEVDQRWVEVDYGEYEGRAIAEVPGDVWRRWRSEPDYRPEGGESLSAVGVRVRQACEELSGCAGTVVVVSHVSPIKAAVAWALGTGDATTWRLRLATGSITRIAWGPDGPVLETFNWVPLTSA